MLAGVLFPLLVVAFELATGLCAGFVDPLPTWPHLALILCVPAINFLLWRALRGERRPAPWHTALAGAAAAIAGVYALLLLPLAPLGLIGLLIIIGAVAFGPLVAFATVLRLTTLLRRQGAFVAGRFALGVAGGLLALAAADAPVIATRVALDRAADPTRVADAVALVQRWGNIELLRRIVYNDRGVPGGILPAFTEWTRWLNDEREQLPDGARALYYRATGTSVDEGAPPHEGLLRHQRAFFDDAQGGELVGGVVPSLTLATSRIEGRIDPPSATAELAWDIEFANAADMPAEARMTLALPPGGVVSGATLWVAGEPRPALIAGRAETRRAYERVVVRERRDPILITTDGADRVLAQAFPVPAGGRLRARIAIAAPLEVGRGGARSLALPATLDRNFGAAETLRHRVWIDGGGLSADAPFVAGNARLTAALDDAALARRPRIAAGRITAPGVLVSALPGEGAPLVVTQRIVRAPHAPPASVIVVLDGSRRAAGAAAALVPALDTALRGARIGLVIAGTNMRVIAPAPWTAEQRTRFAAAIAAERFRGGEDNRPALAAALDMAGEGAVIWVHGPQPVSFADDGRLAQRLERGARPPLVLYQAAAGPNRVLTSDRWFATARVVPSSGDTARDLGALFVDLLAPGPRWVLTHETGPESAAAAAGQPAIARLWAARTVSAVSATDAAAVTRARTLALRAGIVTPLTGAVVLETDADYRANGLAVPMAVPAPGGALLLLLGAAALAARGRRRARVGRRDDPPALDRGGPTSMVC